MSMPGNGIFVVRGEMSTLMTAMRRGSRWNSLPYIDDEKDNLMKQFINLKHILSCVEDLRLIDPNVFLAPFLEVIRTDETTGSVTSLALTAINKFLSYGLIDPTSPNLAITVENIVDAVTHARFMGTDQSSDGVTLFRVVEVLHTLMRSPESSVLSNEAVCEVMLSCFKICFEPRLNELLRRSAEQALKDMVLLLFMRLPQFSEDRLHSNVLRKFQMVAASIDHSKKQRKKQFKSGQTLTNSEDNRNSRIDLGTQEESKLSVTSDPQSPHIPAVTNLKAPPLATTPATPVGNILDMQGKITQTPTTVQEITEVEAIESGEHILQSVEKTEPTDIEFPVPPSNIIEESTNFVELQTQANEFGEIVATTHCGSDEYINSVGVRFTQQDSIGGSDGVVALIPYGLPCIQELFRFLILICNPLDKQNTDTMIHMGLSLLTVAFEVGADNIGKYDTLLELVKDDLCRNLISLMHSERLTIFAADLQLCFLLFESLRGHLKFQMETYLKKLSEIIASDSPKTPYEMRELALDNLLQLWRIPGFVSELYINYDCDLYCTDMFEGLVNLLSKYALSATNAIYTTHTIAADALACVIENIERNCVAAKNCNSENGRKSQALTTGRHSRHNSELEGIVIEPANTNDDNKSVVENISSFINSSSRLRLGAGGVANVKVTLEHLADVKQKKRLLTQGTELFNQRPDKGILYLQENGILNTQLDPKEVASFLRENPGLDKKMIGEYISKKKNVDSKILLNFVNSFEFVNLRIDQALRLYLESFRLPGEAPLIFLVLEHFADHWHKQNGEPFTNTDAAFSLAYAIIMLNMDQHNSNAKRLNVPMTQEDFLKNLRGLNGGIDFDQEMLSTIFNAIKNEEIVMPAEQTGIVRENYLWKSMLRRGLGSDGTFKYVEDAAYDLEIFKILYGASLSALSFMFDKTSETGYQRILTGFTKCAGIAAHFNLHEDFDALILTLCKFTTLLSVCQSETPSVLNNEIAQTVGFGINTKAQAAMRTVFGLVHDYGDCLRDGWKHILEILLQLFRLKLLPKSLIEVEDFCEESGKTQLKLEKPSQKQEAGLFSSLYSYLSSEGQREPTYEELEFIKYGKKCIKECQLDQMIQELKFVQLESLQELLRNIMILVKPPTASKFEGQAYAEDVVVFWMELLVKIAIQNRDRMVQLWPDVRNRIYLLLIGASMYDYEYLLNRSIVAILKLAIYLMRNEELCPIVLQSLKMLLTLKSNVILRISRQISTGVYELLKTSAQNIHSEQDWQIIFTILECVGAGAEPPEIVDALLPLLANECTTKSDNTLSSEDDSGLPDRGYTSDSELCSKPQSLPHHSNTSSPFASSPNTENWILVNKDSDLSTFSRSQSPPSDIHPVVPTSVSPLIYSCKLGENSPVALFKCWDSLAFIVRNVAHITPYNFESCVRCIRTFVECCRDGGENQRRKFETEKSPKSNASNASSQKKRTNKRERERERESQRRPTLNDYYNADQYSEINEEDLRQRYETLSIQLIDLMYTLYTRTAQIFRWWAEEESAVPQCSALWAQGWCPLLQGIARLAIDRRREVRTYAISCLQQRALLVHDLQTLSGTEWASCFHQVLFPLLNELLPESASVASLDIVLLEESRIRTATIMSKVFLHHLTPLIELGLSFNELWIDILDYIDKFMKVGSDMLSEQMQEILKNMLLVMHSVRIFHNDDGTLQIPLWDLTWKRIGEFLPDLKSELFRDEDKRTHLMTSSTSSQSAENHQVNDGIVKATTSKSDVSKQVQLNSKPVAVGTKTHVLIMDSLNQKSPRHSMQRHYGHSLNVVSTNPLLMPQEDSTESRPVVSIVPQQVKPEVNTAATISSTSLPDLIYDTSYRQHNNLTAENTGSNELERPESEQPQEKQSQLLLPTIVNNTVNSSVYNSYSFSIELPDTAVTMALCSQTDLPAVANMQQHNNPNYVSALNNMNNLESVPSEQSLGRSDCMSTAELGTVIVTETAVKLHEEESGKNVPINICSTDQYSPLQTNTNPAIVQSYAPVSMQYTPLHSGETDIYQEYITNPYNLTADPCKFDAGQNTKICLSEGQPTMPPLQLESSPVSVFASPASYFNTNIDPSSIPPGSEMLYGQP